MIVGTAYVEIKAVTDKVRQEIKQGFDKGMTGVGEKAGEKFDSEVTPEIEKTGEKMRTTMRSKATKAGDEAGTSFASRFKAKVSGIPDMVKGVFGQAGTKSGDDFGRKFWKSMDKHFKNASPMKKLMAGLTSFIPNLISLVGALGGGVFALGSAVGQAAGAMPVLYSNMVPVVTLMGGAKLAFSGVGQAIKDLMSGTATPAKLAADMKKLGPAAQQFVKTIVELKPSIDALKQTAAANLFPGLTRGIKDLMPLFPDFSRMIGETDRALGNAAGQIGKMLGGPLGPLMRQIFERNVTSVRNLTGALAPLVASFVYVYHAMQPVQNEMTELIKHGAQWLAHTTAINDANGKMTGYFQRSFDRAKQLGRILVNVAGIILNVAKAASGAGADMLQSIENITKRWKNFTGTAGAQNSMKDWFDQMKPVMAEFMGIIGDIIKDVARLGGSNKDLLPLLTQIRTQLVPALDNLLTATTGPVAQSMVTLLTDLVNIFAKISGTGSTGFLNEFARSLDLVAKGVNAVLSIPGVGQLAGILGGIAGATAAFGLIAGKLRIFKFAGSLLGFGGAAREASKGVDALKLSKMKEAEKLALNEQLALRNAGAYTKMKGAIKALLGGEGLAGLKKALGRGGIGAAEGDAAAGAEGAAGGGIASKVGGLLKGGTGKLAAGLGIGAAAEGAEGAAAGGGIAALFGAELSIPVLGEIAAAITAIGVAVYFTVKNWGAVKEFFTKTLPGALGTAVKAVGHFFTDILPSALSTAASAVGNFFTKTIPGFLSRLPGYLLTGMKVAGKALIQGLEWAIAGAIVAFAILPERIILELIHLSTKIPGLMIRIKGAIIDGIKEAAIGVGHWLSTLPGAAAHWLGSMAGTINNKVRQARNWLRDHIKEGVRDAIHWLESMPSRSAHAISDLPGTLKRIAVDAWHRLVGAFRSGASNAVSEAKKLPGQIKNAIGDLGHLLWDAGVSIIKGMYDGVVHGVEKFGGGIVGKIHSLTKHLPFAHGSPSLVEMAPTLLAPVGSEIVRSMARGVDKEAASKTLVRAVHGAVAGLGKGVTGPTLNAQWASQVSGASGGAAAPINGPLLHIEHFHVRDDRDITNLEHMLYRANQNISRASGTRALPGQAVAATP